MIEDRKSILLLHNPNSGAFHALSVIHALISKLREANYDVESHDSLDFFHQRVDELSTSNRLRAVIAAGGDGTATAVAARIPSSIPMWLCPLGTENLLSRYLKMTREPEQALASINRLQTRTLDAGLANGKLFLIVVGIGFDAEVVRQIHVNRRGHIRRWHYWLPIFKTAIRYRFPLLRLTDFGSTNSWIGSTPEVQKYSSSEITQQRTIDAAWFFLLNLPQYAAGLEIAPDAKGDDGLVDICAFKHGGLFRGLAYFARLKLGIHRNLADFVHTRSAKFRIESISSPQTEVSYQLDGDWGGCLPLEIESLPSRLCMIEPVLI